MQTEFWWGYLLENINAENHGGHRKIQYIFGVEGGWIRLIVVLPSNVL
jgi:hypothetical protein